jgi:ABC-type polar amino acid transport system ATPase subunit
MSTSLEKAKGDLEIFRMCGDIDLCLRKMKKRNIFLVGLSRSGKSTTYNNINNVTLIGTPPLGL